MNKEFINKDLKFELLQKRQNNEEAILEDLLMVEDVLEFIRDLNEKIDFYKSLKEKRMKPIDMEIEKCQTQIDFFKDVALRSLEANNEKTLNFPGVGKVTVKKQKGKWDITDEEALKKYLKDNNRDKCIKTIEKIDKKELSSLLSNINTDDITGAVYLNGKNNITISFSKKDGKESIPSKNINEISNSNMEDIEVPYFDELN